MILNCLRRTESIYPLHRDPLWCGVFVCAPSFLALLFYFAAARHQTGRCRQKDMGTASTFAAFAAWERALLVNSSIACTLATAWWNFYRTFLTDPQNFVLSSFVLSLGVRDPILTAGRKVNTSSTRARCSDEIFRVYDKHCPIAPG